WLYMTRTPTAAETLVARTDLLGTPYEYELSFLANGTMSLCFYDVSHAARCYTTVTGPPLNRWFHILGAYGYLCIGPFCSDYESIFIDGHDTSGNASGNGFPINGQYFEPVDVGSVTNG